MDGDGNQDNEGVTAKPDCSNNCRLTETRVRMTRKASPPVMTAKTVAGMTFIHAGRWWGVTCEKTNGN